LTNGDGHTTLFAADYQIAVQGCPFLVFDVARRRHLLYDAPIFSKVEVVSALFG
jgi:hypothetical protein